MNLSINKAFVKKMFFPSKRMQNVIFSIYVLPNEIIMYIILPWNYKRTRITCKKISLLKSIEFRMPLK